MKAQTPDNPELGCSASGHPLRKQDNTLDQRQAGERQPKAPRRTRSLELVRHGLGRRFPPASAPGVLGLSPGHLPVDPSCPPPTPSQTSPSSKHLYLLPGHRCPPPPSTSEPTAPKGARAASSQTSGSTRFMGGCSTKGGTWEERHTDRGQKSHQIIGKQRACNNEKRTDFVTNHFFL